MSKQTIKRGELINIRWKTGVCTKGESCWCRTIVPEEDCVYEDGTEVFVSASGELNQDMAEHFVELHNDWLNGYGVVETMKLMSDEQVLEVMSHFCKFCGGESGCYCWNDE